MNQGKFRPDNAPLLLAAVSALALGVLVYVTVRAPGSTLFLPLTWSAALPGPASVLVVAGSLPTFFHTLGFSLLLTMLAGAGHRSALWVCATWFAIETAFEAGQHRLASAWLVDHLPQWFSHAWLLERTGAYFTAGVFDPFDIIAAAAGATLAYLLVVTYETGKEAMPCTSLMVD